MKQGDGIGRLRDSCSVDGRDRDLGCRGEQREYERAARVREMCQGNGGCGGSWTDERQQEGEVREALQGSEDGGVVKWGYPVVFKG